jgi:hypothetical protein
MYARRSTAANRVTTGVRRAAHALDALQFDLEGHRPAAVAEVARLPDDHAPRASEDSECPPPTAAIASAMIEIYAYQLSAMNVMNLSNSPQLPRNTRRLRPRAIKSD